jgi:catechol 2,3-dioxygenase-like lactoylglutathione lyase family enzyme
MTQQIAFAHLTLCVPDVDVATDFYVGALGFVAAAEGFGSAGPSMDQLTGIDGCQLRARFLRKDSLFVELTAYLDADGMPCGRHPHELPRGANDYGVAHLAFRVTDLAATTALVAAHGGQVLDDTRVAMPTRVSDPIELVFCSDPFGNRMELIQHPDDMAAATHARWMRAGDLGWPGPRA